MYTFYSKKGVGLKLENKIFDGHAKYGLDEFCGGGMSVEGWSIPMVG